jgi:hypothetical protein
MEMRGQALLHTGPWQVAEKVILFGRIASKGKKPLIFLRKMSIIEK